MLTATHGAFTVLGVAVGAFGGFIATRWYVRRELAEARALYRRATRALFLAEHPLARLRLRGRPRATTEAPVIANVRSIRRA